MSNQTNTQIKRYGKVIKFTDINGNLTWSTSIDTYVNGEYHHCTIANLFGDKVVISDRYGVRIYKGVKL